MNRREMLRNTCAAMVGAAAAASPMGDPTVAVAANAAAKPRNALPRWRGANLLEKFTAGRDGNRPSRPFQERDFDWLAGWGLDFVRLPMDYRFWVELPDRRKFKESVLQEIDQAVEWGRKRNIHVCINFHRAPGYCVNQPEWEPYNLWTDSEAQEVCELHWQTFARRYKDIPARQLSFNLWNEPGEPGRRGMTVESHAAVVRRMVAAIRKENPDRLIIADAMRWGGLAMPELADLGIAQSTRAYQPFKLTHYRANWASGSDKWPVPTWPYADGKERFGVEELRKYYGGWPDVMAKGVGVHCGEGGAYQFTPHEVVLAWMRDVFAVLREQEIGWALWNLRGSFGWVDSGRKDVKYEDFQEHQLDREMLELLRQS